MLFRTRILFMVCDVIWQMKETKKMFLKQRDLLWLSLATYYFIPELLTFNLEYNPNSVNGARLPCFRYVYIYNTFTAYLNLFLMCSNITKQILYLPMFRILHFFFKKPPPYNYLWIFTNTPKISFRWLTTRKTKRTKSQLSSNSSELTFKLWPCTQQYHSSARLPISVLHCFEQISSKLLPK